MTKLLLLSEKQMQFENVQFAFKTNFSGKKLTDFDRDGVRYFNIEIQNQEDADMLIDAGFNVKFRSAEESMMSTNERRLRNGQDPLSPEYFEDFWFMKVAVYTEYTPPVIQLRDCTKGIPDFDDEVPSCDVSYLPIDLIGDIDTMEYQNIDMILTYRHPHERGKYMRPQLKHIIIDVEATPLQRKYGSAL